MLYRCPFNTFSITVQDLYTLNWTLASTLYVPNNHYSGCFDLNEVFGDQKEYSEPFDYFCCPRNQIQSLGISSALTLERGQKKTWEGEKKHEGDRIWITVILLCLCFHAFLTPVPSQLTFVKKHKCLRRTSLVFVWRPGKAYQHKVPLFQQAQGIESLRFFSFEDSRDYSSEWLSSSTSSVFKGFAVAWGWLPVIRCDPTECFKVLGKIDLHLYQLSTSVLLPSRNPTTGVLGIKAINTQ